MKKIVLTGGGTAGHVTPNIALIPTLKDNDFDISYIGAYEGIEKRLIEEIGIPYYGISTGKLRRYMSAKNLTDPFRVIKGLNEARKILKELKPDVVFSKGGFVAVPVVMAASRLHIPVVIHESDITPGLATKLSIPKAKRVCYSFPETVSDLPSDKSSNTGLPIRKELLDGDKTRGFKLCGFKKKKPTILVIGGSLGSVNINKAVRGILDELTPKFNIVHICGKGKVDETYSDKEGYIQLEYVKEDLKDLFALADIVISRAGANSVCEFLYLNKPNILIPLSRNASRGDQILNAKSFAKRGFSTVIEEEELTSEKLLETIKFLYDNKNDYVKSMKEANKKDPIKLVLEEINNVVSKNQDC